MPANTADFGTGAIDWSNYVGANQATSDRDRALVQNYMQGQDAQARQQATAAFGPQAGGGSPGYSNGGAQGSAQASDFAASLANLYTNQGALQTPEGFEQVLSKAQQYVPPGGMPMTRPAGAGQYGGNSFDAALEGTNAGMLYSGAGDVDKFAQGIPAVAAPSNVKPGNTPTYPTGMAAWDTLTQQGQKPTNLGPAPAGTARGTQGGTANPNDTGRGRPTPPPPPPGAPPVAPTTPPPGTQYGSPIQTGPVVGRNRRGTGAP
jgi:hypothetical protein